MNISRKPLIGQDSNSLILLIGINAIVFILLNFLKITYALAYDKEATFFFQKQILNWFALPTSFEKLITRPWTLITYMISTYDVWNLISNMLWLWGFGFILQDLTGNKSMIPSYLYGGFVGGLLFYLSVNYIPYLHHEETLSFLGANAAVMSVAASTTTIAPDYRIFPNINGGIPLWVLMVIFVAIDFAGVSGINGGYAIAHLGGAAIGFLFIKQLKRGNDWSIWMFQFVDWFDNLFNPEKKNTLQNHKERLYYKSVKKPFVKTPNVTQQRLDELLDKINLKGYHMLTEEEKEFLKRASKEEL